MYYCCLEIYAFRSRAKRALVCFAYALNVLARFVSVAYSRASALNELRRSGRVRRRFAVTGVVAMRRVVRP